MKDRFWLRFDGGERGGERVPIPSGGLTIGRGSDSDLVLGDASVSSLHAVLAIADGRVEIRDLGSTNGTRVGASRIEKRVLAHGDRVRLGNVALTFLDEAMTGEARPARVRAPAPAPEDDASGPEDDAPVLEELELEEPVLEEPEPAAIPSPAPATRPAVVQPGDASAERAGEGVASVSAERLARSGKRSWLAAGLLVLLAAGTAGALWWRGRGGGHSESALRAPRVVEGNLLGDDASFERDDDAAWSADEAAPAAFWRDRQFRHSGAQGLGVALAAGEWAEERSRELRVPAGAGRSGLVATAQARAGADASVRLGLELASAAGAFPPVRAWSAPLAASEGFEELEVRASALPGCDRVRVLVAARAAPRPNGANEANGASGANGANGANGASGAAEADGSGAAEADVAVDDVVLLPAEGAGPPVLELQEYELHLLGTPASCAALARIDRVLVPGLAFEDERGEELPLEAASLADGMELTAAAPAAALRARVDDELARQGVATLGAAGYRAQPLAFEADDVTDLLVGSGFDLLCLRFDAPVRVTGASEEGGLSLVARPADGSALAHARLQLAFREERGEATRQAETAREAERSGRLGPCLAAWDELLRRTPFDASLVTEAEQARARLTQQGSDRVQALTVELERARFFDLPDLFRQIGDEARAVATTYAGSEVEAAARELAGAIEAELAELDRNRRARRAAQLEAVLGVLEERGATHFAERVRGELETRYDGVPGAPDVVGGGGGAPAAEPPQDPAGEPPPEEEG